MSFWRICLYAIVVIFLIGMVFNGMSMLMSILMNMAPVLFRFLISCVCLLVLVVVIKNYGDKAGIK